MMPPPMPGDQGPRVPRPAPGTQGPDGMAMMGGVAKERVDFGSAPDGYVAGMGRGMGAGRRRDPTRGGGAVAAQATRPSSRARRTPSRRSWPASPRT